MTDKEKEKILIAVFECQSVIKEHFKEQNQVIDSINNHLTNIELILKKIK